MSAAKHGYLRGVDIVARAVERARAGIAAHAGDFWAIALVATAVSERLVQDHGLLAAAIASTWALPLLARRRFPLLAPNAALVLVAASTMAIPGLSPGTGAEMLISVTAVWALTAGNSTRRAAWGIPALVGAIAASPIGSQNPVDDVVFTLLLLIGAAVAGAVHRRDRTQTEQLDGRVEDLERGSEAALLEAAAAERARIARELHDVVAHTVSVMTVQAGAARLQLGLDPVQARTSVAAVEEATSAALADLDRLMGLLGEEPEALHGLDDIERLVAQMYEAGFKVRVDRDGEARRLPGGLDLALYRILQEALTNARKHAGDVQVDVHLRYAPGEVGLCVTNQAPAAPPPDAPGGHGLLGMRERVELYGGELSAGPRDGTFVVDVRIPIS